MRNVTVVAGSAQRDNPMNFRFAGYIYKVAARRAVLVIRNSITRGGFGAGQKRRALSTGTPGSLFSAIPPRAHGFRARTCNTRARLGGSSPFRAAPRDPGMSRKSPKSSRILMGSQIDRRIDLRTAETFH